ncbi:unnamed protein product [Rotaria sordida]|uniref:Uncharacterized protein n=1 Tax=Rotaria sordida TaxID=392033 RepID=A0A814LX86_9BILA|nr:unnamed protein product [Rotaria sordida]CAF1071519.1 unnamed protein product [Rotaria sordida]CAF3524705.1 unnamed protein product [Rotaria sordida]CAF3817671.1 unnamed protein product [Rotaria sordida]
MLPSIGTTFNFTFNGLLNTMHVSGIYTIQPVIDQDMKTIIGYRNWQLYTGEYSGIFYGVSYNNGTYLQALIDPNTQECNNVFAEIVNCTNWLNTEIIRWDNQCSIVRVDSPISGEMSLTLDASECDLTRPEKFSATATMSGSPDKTTITYRFLSKIEQKNFPYIKCYF